jgi:hypothetical protein
LQESTLVESAGVVVTSAVFFSPHETIVSDKVTNDAKNRFFIVFLNLITINK